MPRRNAPRLRMDGASAQVSASRSETWSHDVHVRRRDRRRLVAAYFAWPYGWVAAAGAYAFGGALCAMVPAAIEWRQEVLRGT